MPSGYPNYYIGALGFVLVVPLFLSKVILGAKIGSGWRDNCVNPIVHARTA